LEYAIFVDQQAANTNAGTFTAGSWVTRVLNTTNKNTSIGTNISLSSNQVILKAGTYYIKGSAPGYKCDRHVLRFYNSTDNATSINGQAAECGGAIDVCTHAFIEGVITITSQKTFELQHICETTSNTYGLGIGNNWDSEPVIFATVYIEKR